MASEMRAPRKNIARSAADEHAQYLTSRVSFNLLTQDADGVRFDRSREFDELDDMRDLLENAVFLASSRCLLLGGKQTFEKSR
jgi:hypothetical protein